MRNSKYFNNEAANKLWEEYFKEVERRLAKLPYTQGTAIQRELESHVFEAAQASSSDTELLGLKKALKDLGDPEDVVTPMVSSALIDLAQRSHNPLDLIRAATFQIGRRLVTTLSSIAIGIISIISLTLIFVAVMKPFLFKHVGLFTNELGAMSFGIIADTENLQEHLGFSIIPIAIVLSYILYRLSLFLLKTIR